MLTRLHDVKEKSSACLTFHKIFFPRGVQPKYVLMNVLYFRTIRVIYILSEKNIILIAGIHANCLQLLHVPMLMAFYHDLVEISSKYTYFLLYTGFIWHNS
jgi:hypothetical protein